MAPPSCRVTATRFWSARVQRPTRLREMWPCLIRCCSIGTWTDGRWQLLATPSRWEWYAALPYGQSGCPGLVKAGVNVCPAPRDSSCWRKQRLFQTHLPWHRTTWSATFPRPLLSTQPCIWGWAPHLWPLAHQTAPVLCSSMALPGRWMVRMGCLWGEHRWRPKWASARTQLAITSLRFLLSLEVLLPGSYPPCPPSHTILSPHAPCPDPQVSIAPCFLLRLFWPGASLFTFLASLKDTKRGKQGFSKGGGGAAVRGAHLLGQGWIPETPVQCGSRRCSCSFQNHFQSPGSPWERRSLWFTCPWDGHSLRPLFIGFN